MHRIKQIIIFNGIIAIEHVSGFVSGDCHYHVVMNPFSTFSSNEGMSKIMESEISEFHPDLPPQPTMRIRYMTQKAKILKAVSY